MTFGGGEGMSETRATTDELELRLDVAESALVRALIAASEDAVIICGPDGRIASWDETASRLFGQSDAPPLGQPLPSLFAEHVRNEVVAMIARTAAGERITRFESECMRPDGMPVPMTLSVWPVAGTGHPVGAMVAVIRDVTERRLAQATLAEVEVRLREGEALAHVGSWLWDLRTDVVQWSIEFHSLHAVDPLEFGGTLDSYVDAVFPDDRDEFRAVLHASVDSGRPFEHEYRVAAVAGRDRRVLIRGQATLGSAGAVVGLRGVGGIVQS
jgi:PAS domain S-box-containing protein